MGVKGEGLLNGMHTPPRLRVIEGNTLPSREYFESPYP